MAVETIKKIVFFGDNGSFISSILFKELIKHDNKLFKIVAVVNTNAKSEKRNYIILLITSFIKKLFNPSNKFFLKKYNSFLSFAKKRKYKIFSPPNINDPKFVNEIKALKSDYGFSFGNPQIMKEELINIFSRVINYHNSTLPKYRGLYATALSMYFGEKKTGFTFHEVNEKIDDGNIIIQSDFEIDYCKTPYEIEIIKTQMASRYLVKLIELLNSEYFGKEQRGEVSYFGNKERSKLLTLKKITGGNFKEIQKLIDIWGGVYLQNASETIFITALRNDGKITRIKWLPPKIYYLYKVYFSYKNQ